MRWKLLLAALLLLVLASARCPSSYPAECEACTECTNCPDCELCGDDFKELCLGCEDCEVCEGGGGCDDCNYCLNCSMGCNNCNNCPDCAGCYYCDGCEGALECTETGDGEGEEICCMKEDAERWMNHSVEWWGPGEGCCDDGVYIRDPVFSLFNFNESDMFCCSDMGAAFFNTEGNLDMCFDKEIKNSFLSSWGTPETNYFMTMLRGGTEGPYPCDDLSDQYWDAAGVIDFDDAEHNGSCVSCPPDTHVETELVYSFEEGVEADNMCEEDCGADPTCDEVAPFTVFLVGQTYKACSWDCQQVGVCDAGWEEYSDPDNAKAACDCIHYSVYPENNCTDGRSNCWVFFDEPDNEGECCETGDTFCVEVEGATEACIDGTYYTLPDDDSCPAPGYTWDETDCVCIPPDCGAEYNSNCLMPNTGELCGPDVTLCDGATHACVDGVYREAGKTEFGCEECAGKHWIVGDREFCCDSMGIANVERIDPMVCLNEPMYEPGFDIEENADYPYPCDDLSDGVWDFNTFIQPSYVDLEDTDGNMSCVLCDGSIESGVVFEFESAPADEECEASCGAAVECDEVKPWELTDGKTCSESCDSFDFACNLIGGETACADSWPGQPCGTDKICTENCNCVESKCEGVGEGEHCSCDGGVGMVCDAEGLCVSTGLCDAANCVADDLCDGKTPSQNESATTGCTSNCLYESCGKYRWNVAAGDCRESCTSASHCYHVACIQTGDSGECLEETACQDHPGQSCHTGEPGICVGLLCCNKNVVKETEFHCVDALEERPGASCDTDLSDGWQEEGVVKLSPDGVGGCCGETQCFTGDGCVDDGWESGELHCESGTWIHCDETRVCSSQTVGGHYCGYDGGFVWTESSMRCGDPCGDGKRCTPGGLCETSGQDNLPIGESCDSNGECCTGACDGGVCSALTDCTTGTVSQACVEERTVGVCSIDCRGDGCDTPACCIQPAVAMVFSEEVESEAVGTIASGYYCLSSLDSIPTLLTDWRELGPIGCDIQADGSSDGFVRESFMGDIGCCSGDKCFDGSECAEEGAESGTTLCVDGVWEECTENRTCESMELKGETYVCGETGWETSWEGEPYCVDGELLECESDVALADDGPDTFGVGDSFERYLCTQDGMEFCNATTLESVGLRSYLCDGDVWRECAGDQPPANIDSGGENATEGDISDSYLCASGKWKACDSGAEGRVVETALASYTCSDGDWTSCDEDAMYKERGGYRCGCLSRKECLSFETGDFGVCTGETCCSGWADEEFSDCFANETAACSSLESGTFVDSVSDGAFNLTGICVSPSGVRCLNDGEGGKMVVSLNDSSDYIGAEKCISSARSDFLGSPCDEEPDGIFDGVLVRNGTSFACGVSTGEKFNVTEEECVCEDDGDICTDDYCENGVCVHERICETCGNGFCAPGECQSCPQDCSIDDCRDNSCNPEVGEGCSHPDCDCDFQYQTPPDTSFEREAFKAFFVEVKNNGNFKENFTLEVEGIEYELEESYFTLEPGTSRRVRIDLLEETPGSYLFEVNIKPEHGSEFTKSVLAVVKEREEAGEVPFIATNTFKYGVVAVILLAGFGSAAFFFTHLKRRVEDYQTSQKLYGTTPYQEGGAYYPQKASYYDQTQGGQQGTQPPGGEAQ